MELRSYSGDVTSNIPTTPKRRRQSLDDSPQFAGTSSLNFGSSQKRPRTPNNSEPSAIATTLGCDREEVTLEWTLPIISRTADRNPPTYPESALARPGSDDGDDDITMDDLEAGPWIVNSEDVRMLSPSSSPRPEQLRPHNPSISSTYRCFGMLLINQIYLKPGFLYKPKQEVAIDGFVIRDPGSGTYGGMFDESVGTTIFELSSTYPVALRGTLTGEKSLSVLVYGAPTDANNVGEFLYRRKFFLQHPDDTFDSLTTYFNPQWLTPPGQEFEVVWDYEEAGAATSVRLTTNDRPIVFELLDSATGPIQFSEIQSSTRLLTELKTYQKKALAMMVEKESGKIQGQGAEFPAVWEIMDDSMQSSSPIHRNTITGRTTTQRPRPCLGGLLADDMGLGKTLTTLALIAGTVDKDDFSIGEDSNPTLIIAPLSTLSNWEDQIARHLKTGSIRYTKYQGPKRRKKATSLKDYNIVLTNYETVDADSRSRGKSTGTEPLQAIAWHRIVLDEAHVIRNRSSRFETIRKLNARHRWCLTGTPIQNRIEDLGAIVEFLRVSPFDRPSVFKNLFVPVGDDAHETWKRLRSLVKAISLRRTKLTVQNELNLLPSTRIDQPVELNTEEREIYDLLKRSCIRAMGPFGSTRSTFQLITRLRQVCNHGRDLLPEEIRQWLKKNTLGNEDAILRAGYCENCEGTMDDDEDATHRWLPCFHQVCAACQKIRSNADEQHEAFCPICSVSQSSSRSRLGKIQEPPSPNACTYRASSKVTALLQNLARDRDAHICNPGDTPVKSIIFSEWIGMLDLVVQALRIDNISFQRIDGRKSLAQRNRALNTFRNDPSCNVLLATLGSAGVGIDLSVASRVHLIEPGWNPKLEEQALDRVHRLGQTREVVTTCYFVAGPDSVEEYIKRKQQWKLQLASSSFADSPPPTQSGQIAAMLKGLKSNLESLDD
ncbi:SNF2 family N-terminal domain-containing protein [Ilyonectria sp. MPI-CAGE-AT-0026]|nr:SNF2 family N-terminal domain-containing protein [Ilyonectria sp. MPI-CAGE-AT-0026]